MSKVSSKRVQVLSGLIDADTATFNALLPVLKKKDLVRLVGLLQQSMLEEQRRFAQLSQCLHALDAPRSASLVAAITRKNNETTDDDDDSRSDAAPIRSLLGTGAVTDDASNTVTYRRSNIVNSLTPELSPLMEMSMVSSAGEGGSRPSSGASFAELTFQPIAESDDSAFDKKLSIQWDNAHAFQDGEVQSEVDDDQREGAIGPDYEATLDELEMRVRAEQEHRDYLARELCLSQSRLAQLCAKNMKIYNLQQERRRRYGIEDYEAPTTTTPAPTASDEHRDHSQQLSSPQTVASSQQQARKSLSTLHKERKLKELSETSTNGNGIEGPSKADLLRQQAFQSVLTDILAGNGVSVSPVEISPESGYNSSSSIKSPSSINVPINVSLSTNQNNRQILLLQQTAPVSVQQAKAKPNELELRASRERILEQVRSRRASAPPVQHIGNSSVCNNRSSTLSPHPQQTSAEQRPLKSILKKRPTDSVFSRSIDNGIHQNDHHQQNGSAYTNGSSFGTRSASLSDGESKGSSVMSSLSDEKQRESYSSSTDESRIIELSKTLSLSETTTMSTTRSHHSPVPLMAHHPGPSEPVSNSPDSPGPYLHHVDYPSPVRNGASTGTNVKHGDLPDVVVSKLGSNGKVLQSPQSSLEEPEAAHLPAAPPKVEKPKSLGERPKTSSGEEDTAGPVVENKAFREWDPRPLVRDLYAVRYEARPEEKRQRFVNMEGHLDHLPMNMRAVVASDTMWRTHYFRTREGRLQWFDDMNTESIPFGEMTLAGAEIDVDKNACMFVVHNAKEGQLLTMRYPSNLLDKWRTALLSHASASTSVNFVRPVYPTVPHTDENICVIEIGSCSIRAGLLTAEPSLPQTYFPSIACILPDGRIVPGIDALSPDIRHEGTIVHPITPTRPALNRYSMDLDIVKHLIQKVFDDLQIDSRSYQIMLSVPQNAPIGMVGDVMRTLLTDFGVRGVFVSRQPFLILYAYDVTTGVVVDFGDRLNIVPVIDGYVVQSAIVSLPYGGHNVSDGLRNNLIERNWTPYSFMSEVEKYILRYVMEKACYVAADFDDEARRHDQNPSEFDTRISIEPFDPTPEMPKAYDVDASRFTSPEGIFKPKRWGFDIDGLHKLVYHAIQGSPLDSRRVLYRNIYLAGGASLLPGLVERLELELAPLVASSVQVRVRTSPWRDHAAYIGAQILAGGIQFEQQLIKDTDELEKFIRRLYSANF